MMLLPQEGRSIISRRIKRLRAALPNDFSRFSGKPVDHSKIRRTKCSWKAMQVDIHPHITSMCWTDCRTQHKDCQAMRTTGRLMLNSKHFVATC